MLHVIPLLDGRAIATPVISSRDLLRMDRDSQCRVSPGAHSRRLSAVRAAGIEIWRIDLTNADEGPCPLWTLEIDTEEDEVRHLLNPAANESSRDRAALLQFLARRNAIPGRYTTRDKFARLALSSDLIQAVHYGQWEEVQVRFQDAWWNFTIGYPGTLAAVPRGNGWLGGWAVYWWLLQAPGLAPVTVLSWDGPTVLNGDGDEINPDSENRVACYTMGLEARLALREACGDSPTLRKACGEAFAKKGEAFLEDWFGIAPAPRRTGPGSRRTRLVHGGGVLDAR